MSRRLAVRIVKKATLLLVVFSIIFSFAACSETDSDYVYISTKDRVEMAKSYIEEGKYQDAMDILESVRYSNDDTRRYYLEAQMGLNRQKYAEILKPLPTFDMTQDGDWSSSSNSQKGSNSATAFSSEQMFLRMTDIPRGNGIKACGYSKEWNCFGIRFTANPDRFYVYFDFPESVYDDMMSSSSPYDYYCNNIRGEYGVSTKYPIPDVKNDSNRGYYTYETETPDGEKLNVVDIDRLTPMQAEELYGEDSEDFFEWLWSHERISREEWLADKYGEDYIED